MLNRIQTILEINPFTIICRWTTGEIRQINMEQQLREWSNEPNSVYKNLLNPKVFSSVQLDPESKTIFWENLLQIVDEAGIKIKAPLDIDPEILYGMSVPVKLVDDKSIKD